MSAQEVDLRLQQFDAERAGFTQKVPAVEMPDEERVARAKQTFLRRLTAKTALSLDSCIRCGMCAEVCHFNETTSDPRYAPVRKYRLLTRVYRRELSPIRWLNRLFMRDITADDLREWQELVYDSCTDCGRCDMICPMGIPISEAIGLTREGLAAAGMLPDEMHALEREQQDKGTLFGVGADELRQVVGELRNEGIEVPLDKDNAEIMVLTSALSVKLFRESLAATARILNHLGADWTIRSDGFEANHYGYLSGNRDVQRKQTRRIADAAMACGAKVVIVPECGHAYMALRWKGANVLGESLPFEVRAISEFIGREIKAGRLRLRRVANSKSVTFHDPCQLGRQGGVFDEPRIALDALGVELREVTETRRTNTCCGAGEGVNWIERAAPLREKAFAFKRKEIDATGASSLVTSCDSCRYNFLTGARQTNWGMPIESLVELVAENLDESSRV